MKEVVAIIRPKKWKETKEAVSALGIGAFTEQMVLGRGKERGLRYLSSSGDVSGIRYLPKRMVTWVVQDHQVPRLVETLIQVNQTGSIGDGKIFVVPIEDAIRIRTGERSEMALSQLGGS